MPLAVPSRPFQAVGARVGGGAAAVRKDLIGAGVERRGDYFRKPS